MAVTQISRNVFDVTGSNDTVLITHESNKGPVSSALISNQHATDDAVFSLYLDPEILASNNIYIIKGVKIPAGTSMVVPIVGFDNTVYALKFTNSGGAPLSIIIR
tara:strand:+ start:119 stop:433 length:315 start_codon:yes stop_codon:yes gene_type:complete